MVDAHGRGGQPGEEQLIPTATPFESVKGAEQTVQFAIDPSKGLTRERYGWYSNDALFDSALFSEEEAGIRLETTATATDEARIRSAYAGQYVSQSLAQPGLGYIVDGGNVTTDGDGYASLTHGEIYSGAFWWDPVNNQVDTGIGTVIDDTSWRFFVKSLGDHIGPSPIPQSEWNLNKFNGSGETNLQTPAAGLLQNFPFTWYNEGPLGLSVLDTSTDRMTKATRVSIPNRPSLDTPNLPVGVVARNAGTADPLGVELGGIQFTTYGSGRQQVEARPTPESRITTGDTISDQRALTENAIDPSAQPGFPAVSIQRDDGEEDVGVTTVGFDVKPLNDDVYVFVWDEWDPETALTGATFNEPVSKDDPEQETKLLTDTQATDYTPTTPVLRNIDPIEQGNTTGGGSNTVEGAGQQSVTVDSRLPIGATRIHTIVNSSGTPADVEPFVARMIEAF